MSVLLRLKLEREAGHPSVLVAGADEVGRGCLAGPVVAAAVILPAEIQKTDREWLARITDSKALSPEDREELAPRIRAWAAAWALGRCSVAEIDEINIYHASLRAMERAVAALPVRPAHVLVDGNALPKALGVPASAHVKGDSRSLAIACASVLAKVWRDRHMVEMEGVIPGYGFGGHKGYPTPVHLKALEALGVSPEHRRTFAPVAKRLLARELK